MKIPSLLIALALLTACSSPTPDATTATAKAAAMPPPPAMTVAAPAAASTATIPATPMSSSMPMADQSEAKMAGTAASATGVVKAIDPVAKTITLDHGAVAALNWPAMVMTFKTGDVDVSSIKPGDHVAFEFTSTGMDGTLTKIDRQ
jgi:Cu(I)/Ag(I) efflux system protein CusF